MEEEDEDGVGDEMRLSGDEDLEGDTVQEAEGSVGSDLDVLSEEEEEPEPAPKSKWVPHSSPLVTTPVYSGSWICFHF